jgi:uncharacterized membrane protein
VTDTRAYRLASLDMLRGLVLVIMALDHARDFTMSASSMDPLAGGGSVGVALFFTRWVTHFCAPVFVFLAGTSAGLMTARRSPSALARFLLTRGLWLLAVELLVMSTAFTFAPFGIPQLGGLVLVGFQVIFVIGASMILLAGGQFLGRRACLAIGAAIVVGHNLVDPVWPANSPFTPGAPLWVALHAQMAVVVPPFFISVLYPLVPWAGVLFLGFGASPLFEAPAAERDRRLLRWGVALTAAFVVLRLAGVYGDPNSWEGKGHPVATLLDVLDTTKYPPSLLFLLMTLGPSAVLCAKADLVPASIRRVLVVFGRVPFAFYVAHFYLVHAISVGLGVAQGFQAREMLTFVIWFPAGYGLSLAGVYVVWIAMVVALYPFCRWVGAVKARRRDWWLSYV